MICTLKYDHLFILLSIIIVFTYITRYIVNDQIIMKYNSLLKIWLVFSMAQRLNALNCYGSNFDMTSKNA